jgi:hypothetical protein
MTRFNAQVASENEEEFVFVRVAVPAEGAMDLGDLDVRLVDLADNSR